MTEKFITGWTPVYDEPDLYVQFGVEQDEGDQAYYPVWMSTRFGFDDPDGIDLAVWPNGPAVYLDQPITDWSVPMPSKRVLSSVDHTEAVTQYLKRKHNARYWRRINDAILDKLADYRSVRPSCNPVAVLVPR